MKHVPLDKENKRDIAELARYCKWSHLSESKNCDPVDFSNGNEDLSCVFSGKKDGVSQFYDTVDSQTHGFVVFGKKSKNIDIMYSGATNVSDHAQMLLRFADELKTFNVYAWLHMDQRLLELLQCRIEIRKTKTKMTAACIVRELNLMQSQTPMPAFSEYADANAVFIISNVALEDDKRKL